MDQVPNSSAMQRNHSSYGKAIGKWEIFFTLADPEAELGSSVLVMPFTGTLCLMVWCENPTPA